MLLPFCFYFFFGFPSCDNKSLEDEHPTSMETFNRNQKELANAMKYSNEAFGNYQLMQTQWHQNDPYNWGTPGNVCSYYPAGCGVIAVAQIVAYYKKCDRNFDFDILTKYPKIYATTYHLANYQRYCYLNVKK